MVGDDTVSNIDSMKVEELREELRKLNLLSTGNKAMLRERLRAALRRREDGQDDVGGEESEADENDSSDDERGTQLPKRREPVPQALSFKDVEDSMQPFSGDSSQNVRQWLEEFEETSEICGWVESHKIIYAKKLLRGSAKVFVSYEKRMTTWAKLKKSLISEFAKTTSSKKVHQELARAKKKDNESYQEYIPLNIWIYIAYPMYIHSCIQRIYVHVYCICYVYAYLVQCTYYVHEMYAQKSLHGCPGNVLLHIYMYMQYILFAYKIWIFVVYTAYIRSCLLHMLCICISCAMYILCI